jgi:hypothetical protein
MYGTENIISIMVKELCYKPEGCELWRPDEVNEFLQFT